MVALLQGRGARLGLLSRDEARLSDLYQGFAGQLVLRAVDVRQPGETARAVEEIVTALGGLDGLILCHGRGGYGGLAEPVELLWECFADNVLGSAHLVRAALPALCLSGGRIVAIGSIAGLVGVPREPSYAASKFALTGYLESLRPELADRGVAVSLVHPGAVDTDFFLRRGEPYRRRFPRPIPPERVARAVLAALDGPPGDRFVPAWLRLAFIARAVWPGLYRRGLTWVYHGEKG